MQFYEMEARTELIVESLGSWSSASSFKTDAISLGSGRSWIPQHKRYLPGLVTVSSQSVAHTVTALAISLLTTVNIFQYDQTVVYRKLLYY